MASQALLIDFENSIDCFEDSLDYLDAQIGEYIPAANKQTYREEIGSILITIIFNVKNGQPIVDADKTAEIFVTRIRELGGPNYQKGTFVNMFTNMINIGTRLQNHLLNVYKLARYIVLCFKPSLNFVDKTKRQDWICFRNNFEEFLIKNVYELEAQMKTAQVIIYNGNRGQTKRVLTPLLIKRINNYLATTLNTKNNYQKDNTYQMTADFLGNTNYDTLYYNMSV